jgi:hypothetical protein
MARRLDALAPTQHPERMSFNKDRVLNRGRTAFGDRSSVALPPVRSAMRSASLGDVKVAPGKAADDTAMTKTPRDYVDHLITHLHTTPRGVSQSVIMTYTY